MIEEALTNEKVDERIKGGTNRRQFLGTLLRVGAAGGVAGGATYFGTGYVGDKVGDAGEYLQIGGREIIADADAATGGLDKPYRAGNDNLEETVQEIREDGRSTNATPEDLARIDTYLAEAERVEDHYTLSERLRQFRDRMQRRIKSSGEKIGQYQPDGGGRGIMGGIGDWVQGMAGVTEEEKREAETYIDRLDTLCDLYDTNDNNLVAQTVVVDHLNKYVGMPTLSDDEREYFKALRDANPNDREFLIRNYKSQGVNTSLVERLQKDLDDPRVKELIGDNLDSWENLLGQLSDGIDNVERLRDPMGTYGQTLEQIKGNYEQIKKANEAEIAVVERVNDTDVVTREEFIQNGSLFNREVYDAVVDAIQIGAGVAAGAYIGLRTLFARRNKVRNQRDKSERDSARNIAVEESQKRYSAETALEGAQETMNSQAEEIRRYQSNEEQAREEFERVDRGNSLLDEINSEV